MDEANANTSNDIQKTEVKSALTQDRVKKGLATAAVVGLGAALIEIEWVPGVLLGAAAMVAPELVPKLGRGIRPFVRSAIKSGYAASRKTREWVAEAGEQISDMVAEVRAASTEDESGAAAAATEHPQPHSESASEHQPTPELAGQA